MGSVPAPERGIRLTNARVPDRNLRPSPNGQRVDGNHVQGSRFDVHCFPLNLQLSIWHLVCCARSSIRPLTSLHFTSPPCPRVATSAPIPGEKRILVAVLLLFITTFLSFHPTGAAAWTAAGPWGGIVHDIENQSSGSATLYAGTGNGIYRYGGTLPWEAYTATLSYRAFEIVPDYPRDALYSIVLPVNDSSFSFAQLNPPGFLYKITLSSQVFTSMGVSDATTLAVCGSGDLLVGTSAGSVLRFPAGSSVSGSSFTGSSEIYSLLAQAGSSTVYMSRFNPQSGTGEIYVNSSCGSGVWSLDPPARSGTKIISFGEGPAGEILAGGEAGQVYYRSSGGWDTAAYGTGLPPYPVVGFGLDSNSRVYALLRDHKWFMISPNNGVPGLFEMPSTPTGSWVRRSDFDPVASRVSGILSAGGYDWVAFDYSGLRRVPAGGSGPGVDADTGISAASIARIYHDPRSSDRKLAVGASGIFERRNGQWRRLLLNLIQGVGTGDTVQWIRESGFLSAAISEDDGSVIWVGGADTGLLRGEQNPAGAWTYTWTHPYWKDTAGFINDICLDPFDSTSLWWVTENGMYMSTNDGVSWSQISNSNYDLEDIAVELTDPDIREFFAGHRQQLGEPNILASDRGSVWMTVLDTDVMIGALEFLPSSSPGGTIHALAGPVLNDGSAIVIEKPVGGQWRYDPQVSSPPTGFPFSNRQFLSISPVLGLDGDGKQDVFAVVRQSAGNGRVFRSEAQTAGGLPGEVWTEITGELARKNYSVTSVAVDPKDGNLLWVSTSCASCYTLTVGYSQDASGPSFPAGSGLSGVGSTGILVNLGWYAPGDDGDLPGWADRYELRYHDNVFTAADSFSAWGTPVPIAAPHLAWKNEVLPVDFSSISSGTNALAFALRAYDEGNRSSAVLTTSLLSPLARQPLADVSSSVSSSQVSFTWSTSNLVGDPYYERYGRIVIERGGAVVAELTGSQKWTEIWSDDIAAAGYSPGDLISYVLKAEDGAGNSAQVTKVVSVPASSTGSGSGGGGGCFIATAAYGSPLAGEIDVLRSYRDGYLVNRWWGRILLKAYYTLSPVPAQVISRSRILRAVSRAFIYPIVKIGDGPAAATALPAILGVLLFTAAVLVSILSLTLFVRVTKKIIKGS